jgi:hypothetical protein
VNGFTLTVGAIWLSIAAQSAPPATPSPQHVAAEDSVTAVVLVKATDGTAVIRVGNGPLQTVRINDLVGTTKAVVKEIGAGRVVLDETFAGSDGKPNRAQIVIKEGERGGTRYLQRLDTPRITGTKQGVITPPAPDPSKPAPKKPPRM